jgi:hypothetical protein
MTYYVSKVFWLLAAPTSALVLISGSAILWAVLGNSNCAAWLAAAAACALIIGAFTPIGLALAAPLEFRFAPSDSQVPPDGIVLLGGSGLNGVSAVAALSQDYSKARLIFSGFRNNPASFKASRPPPYGRHIVPGDRTCKAPMPKIQVVANCPGLVTDAPHAVIFGKGRNLYPASLFLAAFD